MGWSDMVKVGNLFRKGQAWPWGQGPGQGIPGDDGVGVASVVINGSGNLVITLTDSSTHDLGRVVGVDGTNGTYITGVTINGSNHLIVTLSTGATIDAGALPAAGAGSGDMLKSTYDPDDDGKINFDDLENKPTLGTAAAASAADFATAQSVANLAGSLGSAAAKNTSDFAAALTAEQGYISPTERAELHGHSNKAVLDKVSEAGGLPLWNGGAWPGGGAAVQQAAVTLGQNASTNITATTVIGVYESIDNVSIVPVMTSNTTPDCVISSSAPYNSSYDAYRAFDGNATTYFSPLITGSGSLVCKFPGPVKITSFAISGSDLTYAPSSFLLRGSNDDDGTTWDVVNSVINNTTFAAGHIFTVSNPGYYTSYELYATATRNAAGGPNIYTLDYFAGVFNLLQVNVDYKVSRTSSTGEQVHTITRLKSGSAAMVIDYI